MSRIRNADWEDDESLAEELKKYVLANLRRSEVLDFVERDYPQYEWSLGTLSRRMNHFGIKYVDYSLTVAEVEEAVCEENDGPGQLLGYRALQKKFDNNTSLPSHGLWCMTSLQKLILKGWNVGGMWAVIKERGVLRVHSLHW